MRGGTRTTSLNQIAGGTLTAGIIPLARMRASEQSGTNAGAVTLTVGEQIVQGTQENAAVGDLIIATGHVSVNKGLTAGRTRLRIYQAFGAATLLVGDNDLGSNNDFYQLNSVTWDFTIVQLFRCTVAGAYRIDLFGLSDGSNGTIPIGNGHMYQVRLTG